MLVELVKRLKRVLPDDVGVVLRIGVYGWPVAVLCVNRDFEVVDERNHVVDSRVATLIILRWVKHGVEDSPLSGFIGPSDMHIVTTVNANVGVPSPMCTGVRYLGLKNQYIASGIVHLIPQVLGVAAPDEVHVTHRVGIGSHHLIVRCAPIDNLNRVSQDHFTSLSLREFDYRESAHHHQKNHCYAVSHFCSFHFQTSSRAVYRPSLSSSDT